jgi:cobalt/nickel transport system ATP-binding protein
MDKDRVIIHLENVAFAYPGGRPVLDRLNFELRRGEKLGLVGPNGSGKTTFFHTIMGLLRPATGTIRVFEKPVKTEREFLLVRRKIGLLFQDPDDQLFSPTVLEDVAFGPLNLGKSPHEARMISQAILAELGLGGLEDQITHTLSMGQKRLVSLATVLALQPEVLLLDEPTSGLDETTWTTLVDVLNRFDGSYVIISHDKEFLNQTTWALYALRSGHIEPLG